jgi:hypothetical protein
MGAILMETGSEGKREGRKRGREGREEGWKLV